MVSCPVTLNFGNPARERSLVVPGMPNCVAQFVPEYALVWLLTVRVNPARISFTIVGVKTRVSESPSRSWPLLVVDWNVPVGPPEKGLVESAQRSSTRTAKLSFCPTFWSALNRKLSQKSRATPLARRLLTPALLGSG